MRKNTVVTIFGGTGFIGSQIVREVAKKGWTVKVVSRVPERAAYLRTCGTVGQVVPFACDYSDPASIDNAVRGATYVVNMIGILHEKKRGQFSKVHTELAGRIAEACNREGVERMVHISALGCAEGTSNYCKSKRAGEQAVRTAFPLATILRPSVVFGPGDGLFSRFAELSRYLPALPLIGGGHTKFQPVYVGDVADAVMAALILPAVGERDPRGKVYELGGPEILSFKEIYERLFAHTGRKRALVTLPWGLAKLDGMVLGLLPNPPLTADQVETLKKDNVVSGDALKLTDLGIEATGMALILPTYLEQYRPGGRFSDKKRA